MFFLIQKTTRNTMVKFGEGNLLTWFRFCVCVCCCCCCCCCWVF